MRRHIQTRSKSRVCMYWCMLLLPMLGFSLPEGCKQSIPQGLSHRDMNFWGRGIRFLYLVILRSLRLGHLWPLLGITAESREWLLRTESCPRIPESLRMRQVCPLRPHWSSESCKSLRMWSDINPRQITGSSSSYHMFENYHHWLMKVQKSKSKQIFN